MEETKQQEGGSEPSAPSQPRSKKPDMALYTPKGRKNQAVDGQPSTQAKEKPQPGGDKKSRPRPRYTDKARKYNSKNKKDKGGGEKTASEQHVPNGEAKVGDTATDKGEKKEGDEQNDKTHADTEPGLQVDTDNRTTSAKTDKVPVDTTPDPVATEKEGTKQQKEDDEEGDDWDALFNDEGDCLDPHLLEEISLKAGHKKSSIQEAQFDYYNWSREDEGVELREDELAHIVEIYDFPPEFKMEDLLRAFNSHQQQGFDIKWIDESHALGLFSTPFAAREALRSRHPMMKVRPLSSSSAATKAAARSCSDYLLPAKERPQTSAALARRLVIGALGVKGNQSREEREAEKDKLRQAKEKKHLAARQREDAWEGK